MRVHEIMSRPAVTCGASDSAERAAQLMWDHDCGAVFVTADDGHVIGVVTDRDICMAAYTQGAPLKSIRVEDAMARRVHFCREDDTLEACERLMSEKQIRRVPVVDGQNRPVGAISQNDIARYAASSQKPDGREHLARMLAAIGQRRSAGPGLAP